MFYCYIHNWFSSVEPCVACHQVKTVTAPTMVELPTVSEVSYFQVADNSDAFHDWLDKKNIEYIRNGHFTAIPVHNDIFKLAMEFGVYKKENQK